MRSSGSARGLVAVALAGALAAGCVGPSALAGLSAEQIAAAAKIRDANLTCVTGMNAVYGKAALVFVSVDKGIPASITVAEDCKVTLSTGDKTRAP